MDTTQVRTHGAAFIRLVDKYNALGSWRSEGVIEYLFFEAMEGLRKLPFWFWELTREDHEVLVGVAATGSWPYWDRARQSWAFAPIADWREHMQDTSGSELMATGNW